MNPSPAPQVNIYWLTAASEVKKYYSGEMIGRCRLVNFLPCAIFLQLFHYGSVVGVHIIQYKVIELPSLYIRDNNLCLCKLSHTNLRNNNFY